MNFKVNVWVWILLIYQVMIGLSFLDFESAAANTAVPFENKSDQDDFIRVNEKVSINGEKIYLQDIAEIKLKNNLKEDIGAIYLGASPKPGMQRTIPGSWIQSKIRSQKGITNNCRIFIPNSVKIKRVFQTLSNKQLEQFFCDYVASKINDAEYKVSCFKIRGIKKIPVGKISLTVQRDSKNIIGRVSVVAGVNIEGKEIAKVALSGWVERYATIVCSKHIIPRGTVLRPEYLYLKTTSISRSPARFITSIENAVGKSLRRGLKADAFLQNNILEMPPLVYKGDRVKLVAKNDILDVLTIGIAKTQGAKGQQIEVENISSKKTVVGRVLNASTVEVLF